MARFPCEYRSLRIPGAGIHGRRLTAGGLSRGIVMHIGFIGLGNMGRAIAANLIKGGHTVTVWNRSPEAAAPLRELGASVAGDAPQACEADVVFSMLADDQSVAKVFLEDGALARMSKNA